VPREGEPGFLCCPARKLFLHFREEAALEPERLRRGGEALFVGRKDDPSGAARALLALAHKQPCPIDLAPDLLSGGDPRGGMLVGVAAAAYSPARVRVLYADGRAADHPAERAKLGQLFLAEPAERATSHPVADLPLSRAAREAVVRAHAAARRLSLARLAGALQRWPSWECEFQLDGGRSVVVDAPPRPAPFALLEPCQTCWGEGSLRCGRCRGRGTYCGGCQGTGRRPSPVAGGPAGRIVPTPTRADLLAQIAGMIGGPGAQLAACLDGPGSGLAACLDGPGSELAGQVQALASGPCPSCGGSGGGACPECGQTGKVGCTASRCRWSYHAPVDCLGSGEG
jgi:hypothetical protein